MTTGLYAGSFDPIHRGHVELIEAAASCLDRLFVVAAANPNKPGSLLSLAQRRRLIVAATVHLPNVVALAHPGLVADLATQLRVDVLVRSMGKEQRIEFQMAATNTNLSGLHTIFFSPTAETAHISSRMIRELTCAAPPQRMGGLAAVGISWRTLPHILRDSCAS